MADALSRYRIRLQIVAAAGRDVPRPGQSVVIGICCFPVYFLG